MVACRLPNDDDQPGKVDDEPVEKVDAAGMAEPFLRPVPSTPAPSTHQRSNLSHVSLAEPDEIVQPRQRANSDAQKQSSGKASEKDFQKPRKHRPLSWFPPSNTTSRKASHLPKESIASALERSVISAPVLTSTTNAKVAVAEGVQCGAMTASGLATSSCYPKSGWIPGITDGDLAHDQPHKAQEKQSPSGQKSQPHQCTKGLREMPKRPSKRSASMNALSKVRDALTSRLRQASDPQTYRSVFSSDKFVRLGDDCRPQSPANDKLARVRTEGRNLGRNKIRQLTGYGHIRRKPVICPGRTNNEALTDGKNTFLVNVDDTTDAEYHRVDHREHPVDFHFEDLESSFARAVEDLDFRIMRDKASLNSLSSFFHSSRNTSTANKIGASRSQQGLHPRPYPHPVSNADHPSYQPSPHPTFDQLASAQPSMGQCASRAFKLSGGRAKAPPEVHSSPYQIGPAPNEEIDKANRTALAQRTFSRGHSNPLASHPDLTKFADLPTRTTGDPKLPGGPSGAQITYKEHDPNGLEGAPIYSPSLENLSLYERNTPPSAPGSTNISSRKLHSTTSRMRLIETPTRPPRRGTNRRQTAPNNNRHHLKASSSEAFGTLDQHESNHSPLSNLMQSRDLFNGGYDHSERVLQPQDQNVIVGDEWVGNNGRSNLAIPSAASRNVI